ncbi:endonuclease domain-containing protein [Streptomyces sp. NPDC093801]|uniref:endonuclease domain-containing protein n=1 Tax=Streptomyces sp. NPDC093801 TaxID=3155203 RepID=UPI00344DFA66
MRIWCRRGCRTLSGARLRQQHPDCDLCQRRPPEAVDHDAVTGRVRGVVCGSCNSWLGTMESALRVPRRLMQTQAAYLHWRFEAGGAPELTRYRESSRTWA